MKSSSLTLDVWIFLLVFAKMKSSSLTLDVWILFVFAKMKSSLLYTQGE
jgi:hypothetical protein